MNDSVSFFKKKPAKSDEEVLREQEEECEKFLAEHEYRTAHDPEYRQGIEKKRCFFQAGREAEESAGLVNKLGSYTFTCPNCGSECKGEWVNFDTYGNRHGYTGCHVISILRFN